MAIDEIMGELAQYGGWCTVVLSGGAIAEALEEIEEDFDAAHEDEEEAEEE